MKLWFKFINSGRCCSWHIGSIKMQTIVKPGQRVFFRYLCVEHWALLAWIARCPEDGSVPLWCCRQVETRIEWFCESVWPSSFTKGDFDWTDLVAGTGGRCRVGKPKYPDWALRGAQSDAQSWAKVRLEAQIHSHHRQQVRFANCRQCARSAVQSGRAEHDIRGRHYIHPYWRRMVVSGPRA